jgi:hypothetical protein
MTDKRFLITYLSEKEERNQDRQKKKRKYEKRMATVDLYMCGVDR